jgi:dTDP-4-amino-4,6-dideoxygalactose transaminase
MKVNFVDLHRQLATIEPDVREAIDRVLSRGDYILGQDVKAFESEFAAYSGSQFCVGVGSGTAAIEMGLRALGIGAGDEVIIPANTFIASALGISQAGARPALVDVDPKTANIDVSKIEAAITPSTKAIMPVHLYGCMAEMDEISEIADRHGLLVIEDACQAHGAEYKGRRAGSLGRVAAFSFYPGKNLGAYGDGGAITTNDRSVYERLVQMRDFGQVKKYEHLFKGTNSRLDTIQAAVLRVKLGHLDDWNSGRREAAALYDRIFAGTPVKTLSYPAHQTPVYHLYVVQVPNREATMDAMRKSDIGFGIHYPIPIHKQHAYAELAHLSGTLPVTEEAAGAIVSLPMFGEITEDEVRFVADAVLQSVAGAVVA